MSTAYSSAKQQYIGNGVTTEWGFDFPIQKHSELKVYLKRSGTPQVLLEEGVDYSFVTENTIAFPIKTGEAKLQAADVLALQRESVFESEYNFSNQQRLEPEEVMHADDNLERQIQELKRDSESAIKVLPTSNVDPNTFFEQVDRVYGSVDNIDTVANDKANVDSVAGSITNVNKTAGSIDNVNVVAPSISSVNTVAANISSVNTAASNMAAINAAPTAASNAAQSAANAANSATISANSAIWAEGTDAQVAALGGVHSSKVWAEQSTNANIALTNSPYTTNRILEIPQDIKLELNNGTLTLKAGSKVYVPNGPGTFDAVTIASDVSTVRTDSQDCMAWYDTDTGTIKLFPSILFYSGTTAPSSYQFMFWYDTTNNKCKATSDSGSTWVEGKSFPICVVSTDGTKISTIKQVFNGFGYIGSTVFALPGVKVQIPNGRNKDGTCRSIIATVDSVKTTTRSDSLTTNMHWYLTSNLSAYSSNIWSFDADKNIYVSSQLGDRAMIEFASGYLTSGKITSFEPYTVDSVVNSNEFYQLRDKAVTTDTVQTISVGKVFTAEQVRKSTVIDITIQPENYTANNAFRFSDKNGKNLGWIENAQIASGEITTGIHARNKDGYQSRVSVFVPLSGTTGAYAIAPTPPVNATNNNIVTAGWFNSKMQVVSALPAAPDANVFYFIPD